MVLHRSLLKVCTRTRLKEEKSSDLLQIALLYSKRLEKIIGLRSEEGKQLCSF